MKEYQPSGKTQGGSIPALWGFGLASAVVVALIVGVISKWLDLILVFSIGIGCLAGVGLKFGAKLGHCRNAALLTYVAIFVGLVAYGGKMYVNYRIHRNESLTRIEEDLAKEKAVPGVKLPTSDEIFDEFFLKKKTGSKGFVGWVKLTLDEGISITSSHGSSSKGGLNLGYWGSLILILIELGLSMYFCHLVAKDQLKEPYCERCFLWAEPAWSHISPVDLIPELAEKVKILSPEHPFPGLLSNLPQGNQGMEHGKLVLKKCLKCQEGYLTASVFLPSGEKNQFQETEFIRNAILPPALIENLMTPTPQNPPEEKG